MIVQKIKTLNWVNYNGNQITVQILFSLETIESVIDKKIQRPNGHITREETSLEYQIVERQKAIDDTNSTSWLLSP